MIIYIINVSLYNIIINFYPRLYILISTKSFQQNFKVNFTFQKEKVSCPFSLAKESKKEVRKLSHEQIKAKYKTELCKYYELNLGYCKFGDNVNIYINR